jgi:hypothetical protein
LIKKALVCALLIVPMNHNAIVKNCFMKKL